jgi:hypothetical protein
MPSSYEQVFAIVAAANDDLVHLIRAGNPDGQHLNHPLYVQKRTGGVYDFLRVSMVRPETSA